MPTKREVMRHGSNKLIDALSFVLLALLAIAAAACLVMLVKSWPAH